MAEDWIAEASDEELVRALCDIEDGLDEWEVKFADSVYEQCVDSGEALSVKQRMKAVKALRRLES